MSFRPPFHLQRYQRQLCQTNLPLVRHNGALTIRFYFQIPHPAPATLHPIFNDTYITLSPYLVVVQFAFAARTVFLMQITHIRHSITYLLMQITNIRHSITYLLMRSAHIKHLLHTEYYLSQTNYSRDINGTPLSILDTRYGHLLSGYSVLLRFTSNYNK